MSTKLTKKGIPMVESQALKLVIGAAQVHDLTTRYLSKSLISRGYKTVTPSILNFLSTLECGVNYGSEIARNLGVSRQMVAKTVKALCRTGYLEQVDGVAKQKEILFTETGELLMSDARQILADIDRVLIKQLGQNTITNTVANLAIIKDVLAQQNDTQQSTPLDTNYASLHLRQ